MRILILEQLKSGQPKSDVVVNALKLNSQQGEPISEDEVLSLVEELFATLETEMNTEALLKKLTTEHITLFSDDLSEPHFFCEGRPFPAPSKSVEDFIKHRFYLIKAFLPHKSEVRSVFDILESRARFEAPKVRMFNRAGKIDGNLYYDLCDKRLVKVTPTSWEIVPAFPLFRRYKHQQAQVEPVTGGDPWEMFKFLTITDEPGEADAADAPGVAEHELETFDFGEVDNA